MTAAGTQAMDLADAARFVIRTARPGQPEEQYERVARQLVMRAGERDGYRAELLRTCASFLRHDPDGLRRLQAARNVLLHPPARPSPERGKPEQLDHHTSKETP